MSGHLPASTRRRTARSPARSPSPQPARKKRPASKSGKAGGLWSRYQSALIEYPFLTNSVQSTLVAALAVVLQQAFAGRGFSAAPVYTAVAINLLVIMPICSVWFSVLCKWKLHWVLATAVDQFAFSPLFNIVMFWAYNVAGGAIRPVFPSASDLADATAPLAFGLSLHRSAFSSVFAFSPMWSTQMTSYKIWLPAALLREKLVPPHFAMVFNSVVAFGWNMILASILAETADSSTAPAEAVPVA
jgi:hypothetical protein